MAYLSFVVMAVVMISSSSLQGVCAANEEMTGAIEEMQKANYFTFVLLLKMAPFLTFRENITFLMPNDRALSQFNMAETTVPDFLLRHSIPAPLLFDHLQHFPTGSFVPTSKPGSMFKVGNDGRRNFFLDNVRIVSPNICTRGSSIRCHGVDGVVRPVLVPPCSAPPEALPPSPPPPAERPPQTPAVITAPSPSVVEVSPRTSAGSSRGTVVDLVVTFCVLAAVFCIYW